MAFRWSIENVVVEHKDLQANTMALDCKGRFVLLAGRRNIAIIDLENPSEIVKKMSRNQQKFDVSVAEWNPLSQMEYVFVLAVGEKSEIFRWSEGILSNDTSLRAHTRTITDLNWHKFNPNLLATCSIDTFLHVWDIREPRKPAISLSSIAGAAQVKWNKLNSNYLASGHDCDIRIWDHRKYSQPICYIKAHLSKIHGLDWSPNHENQIVSSSNDSTVKFFDITNARKIDMQINTQSPVWRARYTPFGSGVITVVVPPLRRGDNSLHLWSLLDCSTPVHTFVGHSDVVLEFEWRDKEQTLQQEYQLVTWSRDNSLRIWRTDPQLVKLCSHSNDEDEVSYAEDAVDIESSDNDTLLGSEHVSDGITKAAQSGFDIHPGFQLSEKINISSSPVSQSPASFNTESTITPKRDPPKTLDLPVTNFQDAQLENAVETIELSSFSQTPVATSLRSNLSSNSLLTDSLVSFPSAYQTSNLCNNAQTLQFSLESEFSSLNTYFDKAQGYTVEITKNLENRICQVHIVYGSYVATLEITFPSNYPRNYPPFFRFCPGTNIDGTVKTELLRVVKNTALQNFKKRKNCLEHCIKIFVNQLKALVKEERSGIIDMNLPGAALVSNNYSPQMYGGQQDYNIPFPRTSGARFCGSGMLVCFTRPSQNKQSCTTRSTRAEPSTPRSLSALGAYTNSLYSQIASTASASPKYSYIYSVGQSPSIEQHVSVSAYYSQDRKVKSKRGKGDVENKIQKVGIVTVYDVTKLMPIYKELASLYAMDEHDKVGTCNRNRDAALAFGRKDLAQVWSLAASVLGLVSSNNLENGFPWSHHPFARNLIMSIIDHYHTRHDVQTAAMLSCIVGERPQNLQTFSTQRGKISETASTNRKSFRRSMSGSRTEVPRRKKTAMVKLESLGILRPIKAGGSPYNTIHCTNTEGFDMYTVVRHGRSNSEGSLADASRPPVDSSVVMTHNTYWDGKNLGFIDINKINHFEEMRRAYAEILYRWDLLEQKAMVYKFIRYNIVPVHKGVEFQSECLHCYQSKRTPQCPYCKKFSFYCAICHLSVRGSSIFCIVCGHGGHSQHYLEWFEEHNKCPTGCECECLNEMDQLFHSGNYQL